MNKVILIGRLTRDPESKTTQGENQTLLTRYTLAVDRKFTSKMDNNSYTADFISCVAFGKSAEFAEKYLKKGIKIAITGHLQTSAYTNKEGIKVYNTDVVIDTQEFVESKGANSNSKPAEQPQIEEELPFN